MELLNQISSALQAGEDDKVGELTAQAIEQALPPKQILDEGLIAGMNVVGDKFGRHEIFLPDVLLAAKAMYAGMDKLKPLLLKEKVSTIGKIVIGTVQGDLHDIGKIGIPEHILNKEGRLTPEEYSIIKKHSEVGYEIVSQFPNLRKVAEIVRSHHEMLNGSGYPDGMKEEEILLSSQILTVADIYEALISDRPYRKGHTREEAFKILEDLAINQSIVKILKTEELRKS